MMSPQERAFAALQRDARRVVAENARQLHALVDPSAPLQTRAGRWWDFPAKRQFAEQVNEEERARARQAAKAAGDDNPRNDRFDAERHARASHRLTQATGPLFAHAAGTWHEIRNVAVDKHPLSETMMDLRNNAEGRRAALAMRPIDRTRLQTRPAVAAEAGAHAYPDRYR
jgi:hypothetical protein